MVLSPVSLPDAPVEMVLARLKGVRTSLHGWVACCPAHSDREPSLSIGLGDEGQVLLNCFAGCSLEQIVEAMGITIAELFPKAASVSGAQSGQTQRNVLTLVDLASDKLLHWKYLMHLGVTEQQAGCLQIPYHLPNGTLAPRHRLRTALVAKEGSHWSKGQGEIVPYGLERLEEARKAGYLVIVEGESDCWTLWFHYFPALGLPGVEMVSTLKEAYLAGIDKLYIVREPDAAGARFVQHLERLLQAWKWPGKAFVVSLDGAKDPNELHKRDWKGFKAAFQQVLDRAELLGGAHTKPAPSSSEYRPAPFTLQELLARQLPPIRWAIPDILPEGLTLLAGKPKLGKSWLALSVALAVAAGGVALGTYPVKQGEVLYLALEDNERRLQSRAKQLLASMSSVPNSIAFELRWPRLDQGGLAYLFDPLTALWTQMGNAEEVRRTKERQEILNLLAEQLPEGMSARQMAEALDKNYHTTRCLLRKMEAAGEICHVNNHYLAIAGDHSRNQSEPSAQQLIGQLAQCEEPCPPTCAYSDYGEYTHQRVSASESRTQSIPPPFGGCSLQFPSAPENLLSEREVEPDSQNHRDDAVKSVIKCNHRNQSMSATIRVGDPIEQSSSKWTDYSDYSDYADDIDYTAYANDSISAYWSKALELDPRLRGVVLQLPAAAEDLPSQKEDVQGTQDHLVDYAAGVINHNHRNQSDLQYSQASLRAECHKSESAVDANDSSPGNARASPFAQSKKCCPHHPHARWVRFDPSGQAWCDKMDCWDCYRLMKIGEALGYPSLSKYARGIVSIGQGIESWSSFVTSQGSFAVLTATQYAIDLCKALEMEVPDLSGEVQRLVSARE
jgi:hypothetical protein